MRDLRIGVSVRGGGGGGREEEEEETDKKIQLSLKDFLY